MASVLGNLRRSAGFMTQGDLAEKIGVERVTISRWESGRREPRLAMITRLSKTLNVTERELIAAISASKPAHNGDCHANQTSA